MSEQDISTMPAGSELDAAIAREVMGWHQDRVMVSYWSDEHNRLTPAQWTIDGFNPWRPSTDWRAAGAAMEHLREQKALFRIDNDEGLWHVRCEVESPGDPKGWQGRDNRAPSGPLAICRAALMAVRAMRSEP